MKRLFFCCISFALLVFSASARDMSFWQIELLGERFDKINEGSPDVPVFQTYSGRKGGELPLGWNLYSPEMFSSYNSAFPFGGNDGAMWQGRGLNTRFSAGVEWRSTFVHFSFIPEVWGAQNVGFGVVPGTEETADYWWGLDRPQRFGDGPHWDWSLGQTAIRGIWEGFTAGFSTENIWLGPGIRNSIILSTNAGGFPHFDLGTQVPFETRVGSFQAKFLWARLQSSEYFTSPPDTSEYRLFTGGTLAYSPSLLPGLTLGFNRYFLSPWDTLDGFKVFQFFVDSVWKGQRKSFNTTTGEDDVDQVVSLTLDWVFKPVGLNIYLEWARNDHATDIQDFLMQLDHSHAYVLGLVKKIDMNRGESLFFHLEFTDLGNTIGTIIRPTGPWYRHRSNPQGYTYNGQDLGAAIGTGSSSQFVGFRYLSVWGEAGVGVERVLYDADYYYTFAEADNYYYRHYNLQVNLEVFVVLKSLEFIDLFFKNTYSFNYNHNWRDKDVGNFYVNLGLRWKK
jgi:hypothetical protein